MKKIFCLVLFLSAITVNSQNITRTDVQGKIVIEHSDISGITIFNASSNKGTITDNNGEFKIAVALNDIIEVSALQFQNLSFKVNKDIVASRNMKIFLIEEINKLDEIIVKTKGLSGNLETDIGDSETFNPKLDALYFGVKHSSEYSFETDYKTEVKNMTVNAEKVRLYNGLNIVNVVDQLLLPVFRSEAKEKKASNIPKVPSKAIKYYFASEFLVDNFKIPEHRVEDFIAYVHRDDFDFSLLNYGKELEFLELLNQKSVEFLNKK
ncbi:carboxypeptidase-like regulatory domain-containing protein [Algibacter sp. 2305UL17-15]|uniref:carboxypeptidase-like regulatory domain-containing protein n=1 Tax=Algibacter sp. 2305UL17-15 TaxID=3231268 RepID=UPI00345918AA